MNTKFWMVVVAVGLCSALNAAVPSLKGSAEPAGTLGIKVRALSASEAVPAATPQAKHMRWQRGDESGEVTHYVPRELWLAGSGMCQWKDRKGNQLMVAGVKALCPEFDDDHAEKAEIEKALAESAAEFKAPTDETLATWVAQFSEKPVAASALKPFPVSGVLEAKLVEFGLDTRCGAFFKAKDGAWRYAEFRFAKEAKPKEAPALMKKFLSYVVVDKSAPGKGGAGGVTMEGKWMTLSIPGYTFKTDLPKSQAGAFLKDTSKYMAAMQSAYKRYVPPQRELKQSTIRVFSTREGYNGYISEAAGSGGDGSRSIGLWNPTLEELLILNQGKDVAERRETMKILRHEAFHQYLFYATGNGDHAMWFNEGHACFFENVLYSAKNSFVKFVEDPKDRRGGAVGADPEKYANLVPKILHMDHSEFYSGSLSVVNDKYTAAWAAIYFLEKGAPAMEEFAAWRGVLPTYLKETASGKDWKKATDIAWEGLVERFPADFLKFWHKRAAARNYEPAPAKESKETK